MEIYWLGHGCFRLRGRDATVLCNPAPPTTGYRIGKINADVVTISSNRAESSFRQAVAGEAKFITGPGEYEIAGVLITGVRTDHAAQASEAPSRNIAYVIDLDDVRICHLGDIAEAPTRDDVEVLGTADILLIPVGGGAAFDAERAAETVALLSPKIVVPMMYKTDASTGTLEPVERFLKEMGAEAKTPEQRLSITKSGVPGDLTLVVLNSRGS